MIKLYSSQIVRSTYAALATPLLEIAKPKSFNYIAGQFTKLIFPQITSADPLANWRWFSLASAPHEKTLLFVGRDGVSDFKKAWRQVRVGDSVSVSEARGIFTVPAKCADPLVFIAGGVGIAPIRSIVKQLSSEAHTQTMTVFYSGTNPQSTAFLEEFEQLANDRLIFVPTMTNPVLTGWSGERGRITITMLQRYVTVVPTNRYYVVGPPDFVKTLSGMLVVAAIPADRIIVEKFIDL